MLSEAICSASLYLPLVGFAVSQPFSVGNGWDTYDFLAHLAATFRWHLISPLALLTLFGNLSLARTSSEERP